MSPGFHAQSRVSRFPHLWGSFVQQSPPAIVEENKSAKTRSAWGEKVANLSKKKGPEPVPQWAFIGFNLHRNTGHVHKAHQSLSGSNDQTIDNTQRTMKVY